MAALTAALVVAGCASPMSPPPTQVQTPGPDDAVYAGYGRPGLRIEASLAPAVVMPGGSVTVHAAVVNDDTESFEFQDCRAASFPTDDHGQAWGLEVRDQTRLYQAFSVAGLCPDDPQAPRASLAPGERADLVHTWGQIDTQGAPPGPFWLNLTFHGLEASLPFTLSFGEGEGEPRVELLANRTTLREGDRVLVSATVTNPTSRSFRYFVGSCGESVGFHVSTDRVSALPPSPDCMGPSYYTNLAPGQTLRADVHWDGTSQDAEGARTREPGRHTVSASFAFTDGHGQGGLVTAQVEVVVE